MDPENRNVTEAGRSWNTPHESGDDRGGLGSGQEAEAGNEAAGAVPEDAGTAEAEDKGSSWNTPHESGDGRGGLGSEEGREPEGTEPKEPEMEETEDRKPSWNTPHESGDGRGGLGSEEGQGPEDTEPEAPGAEETEDRKPSWNTPHESGDGRGGLGSEEGREPEDTEPETPGAEETEDKKPSWNTPHESGDDRGGLGSSEPEDPEPEDPEPEDPEPEDPEPEGPEPEGPEPEGPEPEGPEPEGPEPEGPEPEGPEPEDPEPEDPEPEDPEPEDPEPEDPEPEDPEPADGPSDPSESEEPSGPSGGSSGPDSPAPAPSPDPKPMPAPKDDDRNKDVDKLTPKDDNRNKDVGGRKYHLDYDESKEIEITDENGGTRTATVYRIVADKELTTIGPGGESVVVASPGDRGGWAEVEAEPGAEGEEYGDGSLRGLSQEGNSWVHEGAVLAGNASVRDDAQIEGPDTVISGADVYRDKVGVGGAYRSSGASEFSGNGSYVDMTLEAGAGYTFEGNTQIGGPAVFKPGEGIFRDGPEGNPTMMFAAREGSSLTVQTGTGFESNGMTVLDDSEIRGSFKGCDGLIVQDGKLDVAGAEFAGPCTIVNQELGTEADGRTFSGDAEIDAVARTRDGMEAAGYAAGSSEDHADYLDAVARTLDHELGEQFTDTIFQHHGKDDIVGRTYDGMMAGFEAAEEGMTRAEWAGFDGRSSAFHDGLNDAFAEARADAVGKDGEAGRIAHAESPGGRRWEHTSGQRADVQKAGMYRQTSGQAQRVHGGSGPDKDGLNVENAAGNLAKKRDLPSYYDSKADGTRKEDDGLGLG